MTTSTILVVGSTGSIGRLTVAEALARGYRVRAMVRDADRAAQILPADTELGHVSKVILNRFSAGSGVAVRE